MSKDAWKDRVSQERIELEAKLGLLESFLHIREHAVSLAGERQVSLMENQHEVMSKYVDILEERLDS